MTVRELIIELMKKPQEWPVVVRNEKTEELDEVIGHHVVFESTKIDRFDVLVLDTEPAY